MSSKEDEAEAEAEVPSLEVEPKKTIACLFCGGAHIYPGARYLKHLTNEHGVIFEAEFIVQLTLYKQTRGSLPNLDIKGT